ncbi:putative ATPase [Cronobacter phage vB_CsaM_Invicta]|nr:putative ATPase [Cronobacter phage vB_CsaM_Cronuts]UGV22975.1 putative ATPase [Cronobacter phage vB_CsaM_Invicta]
MSKYVLDTNVLISNPYSIYSYIEPDSEIIITAATMEELDHLKSKERTAHEARLAIRLLSKAILGQNYEAITQTGVSLNLSNPAVPESVTLKIVDYDGTEEFPLDKQDARIIATCIQQGATLVTRDINMLLIAMSKGCSVLQYTGDDSLKDSDVLYSGYIDLPLFWETVEVLEYVGPVAVITYSSLPDADFYPNQYILSDGEIVGRVVAAGEFQLEVLPIKHEQALKRKLMKTIQPRDALQASFVDAILDKNNDVVTIMGAAGSGKTMLAVAGAMHMVNAGHFANLMYVKADSPLSGEIGFLPGTLGEKLRPAVEPCITSLNILFKDQPEVDKYVEGLLEKNVVQFPSLYYFRGRSIGHPDPGKGSVLIVDECQNLSNHEIKSIISRCGENTLLILCGNIKQIDNPRNTAVNNGFVYAVEKLKEYGHSSHVILDTVYRGRLAAFVEENF